MGQYVYDKEVVVLPFAGDFLHVIEEFKEQAEEQSLALLQEQWLDYLKNHFFIDKKDWSCQPMHDIFSFLKQLMVDSDQHLLLVSPMDRPEFSSFLNRSKHVHSLHAKAAHNWKLGPDMLENWCRENELIAQDTWVYLPSPVSGVDWKTGELKRLAEVAKAYSLRFLREESMETAAAESLFHFLPGSAYIFIHPYQTFQPAKWQFGFFMWPKASNVSALLSSGKLQSAQPDSLSLNLMREWLNRYPAQSELKFKWNAVAQLLKKELHELLQASRLEVQFGDKGRTLVLDFEYYRAAFGRKDLFTIEAICEEIEKGSGVKLHSGASLGLAPNTLIAVMYLGHFDSLDWLEKADIKPDASFLYKLFWVCIEGAQKLMRYLNTLA